MILAIGSRSDSWNMTTRGFHFEQAGQRLVDVALSEKGVCVPGGCVSAGCIAHYASSVALAARRWCPGDINRLPRSSLPPSPPSMMVRHLYR